MKQLFREDYRGKEPFTPDLQFPLVHQDHNPCCTTRARHVLDLKAFHLIGGRKGGERFKYIEGCEMLNVWKRSYTRAKMVQREKY